MLAQVGHHTKRTQTCQPRYLSRIFRGFEEVRRRTEDRPAELLASVNTDRPFVAPDDPVNHGWLSSGLGTLSSESTNELIADKRI